MKTAVIISLFIHLAALSILHAQLPSSFSIPDGCVVSIQQSAVINPIQFIGTGSFVTSHGVLKILIVMAQFPDDQFEPQNGNRASGGCKPTWLCKSESLRW
ncbi:MAG: hypothetical protein HYX66_03550 [Ignavibacteria bacterium]|nr:hypothetical protein [Ignavibacteria bacterium]